MTRDDERVGVPRVRPGQRRCGRDIALLDRPLAADVQVRVAARDELDIVDQLVDEKTAFHARNPVFRPCLRRQTADAVAQGARRRIGKRRPRVLISRRNGRDIGIISIEPGHERPRAAPIASDHRGDEPIVEPDVGGAGVVVDQPKAARVALPMSASTRLILISTVFGLCIPQLSRSSAHCTTPWVRRASQQPCTGRLVGIQRRTSVSNVATHALGPGVEHDRCEALGRCRHGAGNESA